jgi:hypothetical protein
VLKGWDERVEVGQQERFAYECSRHHERDDTDDQEGGVQLGGHGLEALLRVAKTADKEGHAKDKEEITEKATEQGALDEGKFTTLKSDTSNNEFDEIA